MLGEAEPARLPAEDEHELLVHDLDHLLGGVERAGHLRRQRPRLDRSAELPHHGKGDVRVEQRDADLAHRLVDVGLGQATLAPQAAERGRQAIGQAGEHRILGLGRAGPPGAPTD